MKEGREKRERVCVRDSERIKRDDESVTEEMEANSDAWRDKDGSKKTKVKKSMRERKKIYASRDL